MVNLGGTRDGSLKEKTKLFERFALRSNNKNTVTSTNPDPRLMQFQRKDTTKKCDRQKSDISDHTRSSEVNKLTELSFKGSNESDISEGDDDNISETGTYVLNEEDFLTGENIVAGSKDTDLAIGASGKKFSSRKS